MSLISSVYFFINSVSQVFQSVFSFSISLFHQFFHFSLFCFQFILSYYNSSFLIFILHFISEFHCFSPYSRVSPCHFLLVSSVLISSLPLPVFLQYFFFHSFIFLVLFSLFLQLNVSLSSVRIIFVLVSDGLADSGLCSECTLLSWTIYH
jgi:hypothetical protein